MLYFLLYQVLGKCYVMPVRDYFKYRPEGFEEKDIFVCEWRYTSKVRNWKKIKPSSFWDTPEHVNMVAREVPLPTTKIPAVFKVGNGICALFALRLRSTRGEWELGGFFPN